MYSFCFREFHDANLLYLFTPFEFKNIEPGKRVP